MSEAPFNPGTPPSDLPVKDTLPISPNEIRLRQFVKSAFVVTEGSLGIT